MSANPAIERSDRLGKLAYRLRKQKRITEADMYLMYDAAQSEWDDAIHFAAPWHSSVSLCGHWYRNLTPIDDKGDVGGGRCWTCLHTRDWLAEHFPAWYANQLSGQRTDTGDAA